MSRGGQAREAAHLVFVNIETRQAPGRPQGDQQTREGEPGVHPALPGKGFREKTPAVPAPALRHPQHLAHDQAGHQAAGDHIGQGIELYAEFGLHPHGPRCQAVEEVTNHPQQEEEGGPFEVVQHGEDRSHRAEHHVQQGYEVGEVFHETGRFS